MDRVRSIPQRMNQRPLGLLLTIGVAIALIASISMCARHVSGPRTIASAVAPDGTEMRLVQRCNWSGEPFTTSFFIRKPGTPWGWFYYDHQDDYWNSARVQLDTNAGRAVFLRGNVRAVTFEWTNEVYTLHRWNRTMTGAQSRLPVGRSPM